MVNDQLIDETMEIAINRIRDILQSHSIDEKAVAVARVVTSTLASLVKYQQVKRASEGLNFMIIRSIAKDREELERYVRLSMPQIKALSATEQKNLIQ